MTDSAKPDFWLLVLLGIVGLAACGDSVSEAIDIEVVDHEDPLTMMGGDNLCELTHKGGDDVPKSRLEVIVRPPDGTNYAVDFQDGGGDSKFAKGDTLVVTEPGANLLGSEAEGSDHKVTLHLQSKDDPSIVDELWSGTWTP